jgi:hypothetical protein
MKKRKKAPPRGDGKHVKGKAPRMASKGTKATPMSGGAIGKKRGKALGFKDQARP